MLDYIETLTARHRSTGVLIDTNLLLLLVVGFWRPPRIETFKRTHTFTLSDFNILNSFLSEFNIVSTTPHIATETSNFLGQLPKVDATEARYVFREMLSSEVEAYDFEEIIRPTSELSMDEMFPTFGLADTALKWHDPPDRVVLTDDLRLFSYLSGKGVDVLNYNHLRARLW